MARTAALVLSLLLLPAAAAAQHTLSRFESYFTDEDGTRVTVKVVSAVPGQAALKVLYGPEASNGYSDLGLRQPRGGQSALARQQAPAAVASLDAMAKAMPFRVASQAERVLMGGGFSGYRSDVPVGLLVSGGRVLSPIDSSPPRVAPPPGCSVAESSSFRFSGLLCVRADTGAWGIVRTGDYRPGMCREAVQAGPLLVEPGGEVGICARSGAPAGPAYARLAACVGPNRALHFALTSPTRLFALSDWLARGPLKCDVALNLSGAEQAGWVDLPSPRFPLAKGEGGTHLPLASALLIEASAGAARGLAPATTSR
ncbi:MAG: hypothetical protein ACOZJX_19340 [Pseudomonadota bacterium]